MAFAVLAVCQLTGCELVARTPARAAVQPVPVASYETALRKLDTHIASLERRTAQQPESWPDWEGLANDYRRRAQLSGSYDDYAKAQAALDQAFAVAPEGSGPFLSRAQLNFTMHRIFAVEPDLAAAEKSILLKAATRAQIAALRADVAYCSGQYAEAERGFQAALELSPRAEVLGRMADLAWQTGDFAEARQRLNEAEALYERKTGAGYAVLLLQRGSLEQNAGNTEAAQQYFHAAERAFPGWWLVAEHRLPLQVAELDHAQQLKTLEDMAIRTGRAEDKDQVARLYDELHNHDRSKQWSDAAAAQLKQFPEATYGHAVDHFINFETDPAVYIDIAKRNVAARPMGSSRLKLAQAYFKAGQIEQALAEIEALKKTLYNTIDLHATAAQLHDKLGHQAKAAEHIAAARELNPTFDPASPVIGHHHH
jgi:tetratricopeptide (TPR) repeat protein